ncbi:MFS transporter [Alicyclobacillus vulcanalis]|uniref:Predicted arabinose efflux permease, MFS family n=1 Tax=Alicyclobacillus vulcanalis TaxID=252246 RepID=A0A1N7JT99_9BACL|nr:MFS transporter [Alicyclobacillus vulcanalis]SIS52547.1 Predicted arabinose efflux permease, MFS family [Alicyclobacillus vulcanalis]
MFRVLRRPAFASVWLGQALSQLGTQLFFIMAYWELQLRSPYWLSAAGLVLTLPNLLSAVGGSLVDRCDARRVMLWTDLARAAVSFAGALAYALWPHGFVGVTFVILAVHGVGASLFGPAESVLLPRLVPDEELVAANGLVMTTSRLAVSVGAALGGASIAMLGVPWVAAIDGLSFLASAGAVANVIRLWQREGKPWRAASAVAGPKAAMWTQFTEGWRVVARMRWYVAVLPFIVLVNFSFAGVDLLMSVWTHHVLHAGAWAYGALNASLSLGQVAGSLCAGLAAKLQARTGLVAFGALTALSLLALSVSRTVPLAVSIVALFGGALAIINAIGFALMQRAIPEEVRGRAFGIIYSFAGIATPLASLFAGLSLRVVPVAAWMWLGAASCAALVAGWWHALPRGRTGAPGNDVAAEA